jgi:hypothetical protein
MNKSKSAYFPKNTHPVDLRRFKKLAHSLGCDMIASDVSSFSKSLPKSILISDNIGFFDKHIIIGMIARGCVKNVDYVSLELYSLDVNSLMQEYLSRMFHLYSKSSYINSLLKIIKLAVLLFRDIYEVLLIRIILKFSLSTVYVSSDLRIKYLKDHVRLKSKYILLKNLPLQDDWKNSNCKLPIFLDNRIRSDKYLFMAGNINNFDDFILVCEFSLLNKLIIVVATHAGLPSNILIKYGSIIVETGILSHEYVVILAYHCMAGVVLYRSDTNNQKLSASIKFLEFVYINKPVIVSRNNGILYEAEHYSANIIITDQLKNNTVEALVSNKPLVCNKKLSFENQLAEMQYVTSATFE